MTDVPTDPPAGLPRRDRNPFPGARPYGQDERDRFFGREDLARKLETRVLINPCTTVYGPSGAGKSSLMKAGVIPRLEEVHHFRVARLEAWPVDEPPLPWLVRALFARLELGEPPVKMAPLDALEAAIRLAEMGSERPIFIYLDQLEQLFLGGRTLDQVDVLLEGIDRLVRRPERGLQVVLALREEYLGHLRDAARRRRELLEHSFRVSPLTVGQMVKAVCLAAAKGDPPQTWEEGRIRRLILEVRESGRSATDEAEVQAAFGQIVCRALWRELDAGAAGAMDTLKPDAILHTYLDKTVDELGQLRDLALRFLEDHMIDEEGHRRPLMEPEARRKLEGDASPSMDPEERGKLADTVLTGLTGAAVLRSVGHGESRYFELGHDWLAKRVFERKTERLRKELADKEKQEALDKAEEERREALRSQEEREARLRQEKDKAELQLKVEKANRQRQMLISGLLVVLLVLAGVAFWIREDRKRQESEEQKQTRAFIEKAASDTKIPEDLARRFAADGRWDDAARALTLSLHVRKEARGKLEQGGREDVRVPDPTAHLALLVDRLRARTGGGKVIWQEPGGMRSLAVDRGAKAALLRSDGRGATIIELTNARFRKVDVPFSPAPKQPLQGDVERLEGLPGSLSSLVMSWDGQWLAGRGPLGQLVVWKVETGEAVFIGRTTVRDGWPQPAGGAVLINEPGRSGNALLVPYDLERRRVFKIEAPSPGESARWDLLALTPDGAHVVGLWFDPPDQRHAPAQEPKERFYLWDAATSKRSEGPALSPVDTAVQSSSAELFATYARKDNTVRLWARKGGSIERAGELTPEEPVDGMLFSANDKILLLFGESTIEGWDLSNRKAPKRTIRATPGERAWEAAVVAGTTDLLVTTDDSAQLHDGSTGRLLTSLRLCDPACPSSLFLDATDSEVLVPAFDTLRSVPLVRGGVGVDRVLWSSPPRKAPEATTSFTLTDVHAVAGVRSAGDTLTFISGGRAWLVDGLRSDKAAAPKPGAPLQASPRQFEWQKPTSARLLSLRLGPFGVVANDDSGNLRFGSRAGARQIASLSIRGNTRSAPFLLDLSEDGAWAVTAGFSPKVYVWNVKALDIEWTGDIRRRDSPSPPELPYVQVTAVAILSDPHSPKLPRTLVFVGDERGGARLLRSGDETGKLFWSTVPGDSPAPHKGPVRALAAFKKGDLASGANDGTVAVWNVKEAGDGGKGRILKRTFSSPSDKPLHTGDVTALRFSADGAVLVTGGADGVAHTLWRDQKPNAAPSWREGCAMSAHSSQILAIEIDPDPPHRHAITLDADGLAVLWEVNEKGPCSPLRRFRGVVHAGFVPRRAKVDHRRFVTLTRSGSLGLWEGDTEPEAAGDQPRGSLVQGGVAGSRLVFADEEARLFTLALDEGSVKPTLVSPGEMPRVSVWAAGKQGLARVADDGSWLWWGVGGGSSEPEKGRFKTGSMGPLKAAALSGDGDLVLVEEGTKGKEGAAPPFTRHMLKGPAWSNAEVAPLAEGERCAAALAGTIQLTAAAFAGADPRVVSIDSAGCVRVWDRDARPMEVVIPLGTDKLTGLVLSPDGQRFAVAGADGEVSFWRIIEPSDALPRFAIGRIGSEPRRHTSAVRALAFHPDGRFVVTGDDDGHAWLWDSEEGVALMELGEQPGPILWAAFRPDGREAFTGGGGGWIRAWTTATKLTEKEETAAHRALCDWFPGTEQACQLGPSP